MQYKTTLRYNPEKLSRELALLEQDYAPALYNNIKDAKRYGWALTGRTGKINDIHGRRYKTYKRETEFYKRTKAYRGYFAEVLDELSGILGDLYRARIIGINGERVIAPHHDGHDGSQFFRYHIPIIPNPECTFTVDGQSFQMLEAGSLYIFPGWHTHAVKNKAGGRVHLMFSAFRDIRKFTGNEIGTKAGLSAVPALRG